MRTLHLLACLAWASTWPSLAQATRWTVPREYAISASPDGHFFQHGDGTPFFWQVDTAWELFSRLNMDEAEHYLADRAAKGFTVVQCAGAQFSGIDVPNRAGDLSFHDLDPTKPNEKYWAHVDEIVKLAWQKHSIRVVMIPAWGSYLHDAENVPGAINVSNAAVFGEFIGKRYPYLPKILFGDTNPSWQNKTKVLAEYVDGGVPSDYITVDWSPVYDTLAAGIIKGEAEADATSAEKEKPGGGPKYTPLISIHPQNQWFSGGPLALATSYFGDRSWLTFDVSQSGHADFPPHAPVPWWNCRRGWEPVRRMYSLGGSQPGKKRPALDNEPHYEWRYDNANSSYFYWNASDVRTGAWQSVFSGAAGLSYGADMVWQMYIPGIYTPETGGPAIPWYQAIKLPGSGQMQYVQKAVLDRGKASYFDRIPAQDIIVGDAGTDDQTVTATRDSKGSWLMVYAPRGEPFSIDTSILRGCKVKASWFDPLTGQYTAFHYAQCAGYGKVKDFQPPAAAGHKDWTLVLEA